MKAKSGRSPDCSTWAGLVQVLAAVGGELHERVLVVEAVGAVGPAEGQRVAARPLPVGAPFAMSRLGNELVRAPGDPVERDRAGTPSNCADVGDVGDHVARLLELDAAVGATRASLKTRLLL